MEMDDVDWIMMMQDENGNDADADDVSHNDNEWIVMIDILTEGL